MLHKILLVDDPRPSFYTSAHPGIRIQISPRPRSCGNSAASIASNWKASCCFSSCEPSKCTAMTERCLEWWWMEMGDDVKLEIRVKLMAFSLYFSRKASMSSAWGRLHLRAQLGSCLPELSWIYYHLPSCSSIQLPSCKFIYVFLQASSTLIDLAAFGRWTSSIVSPLSQKTFPESRTQTTPAARPQTFRAVELHQTPWEPPRLSRQTPTFCN